MRENKLKRCLKFVLCLVMTVTALSGLIGCGKKDKIISDPKYVNVRVFKAGYGSDFIYELKDYYEEAFKEEGYKMNILTPSYDSSGAAVISELAYGADKSGVDLYITGNVLPPKVSAESEYGMLVEDLTDTVWNKPAIGFDGKEEEVLIKDKVVPGTELFLTDNEGKVIAFNWVQSAAGMVVNTRKLAKYNLEVPKTTNQLFDCFDKIYLGHNGIANAETSKTFPLTTAPGTTYNDRFIESILAQQLGIDEYKSLMSFKDDDFDWLENGYEMYNTEAYKRATEIAYRAFDSKIMVYGAKTNSLDQAQSKIMKDGEDAIFMFNGDWFLNEVAANYKSRLNDIEFFRMPVISSLGIDLFGNQSDYKFNDGKCEKLLTLIIDLVDENLTVEEIAAAVKEETDEEIQNADILRIAEVRGAYISRGVEHLAYISKGALGKDAAVALLRMFASDDFAPVFAKSTNCSTPYSGKVEIADDYTEYDYVKQSYNISTSRYAQILPSKYTGSRAKMGLASMYKDIARIDTYVINQSVSMFDGYGHYAKDSNGNNLTVAVYSDAANSLQAQKYQEAKANWKNWKTEVGL